MMSAGNRTRGQEAGARHCSLFFSFRSSVMEDEWGWSGATEARCMPASSMT